MSTLRAHESSLESHAPSGVSSRSSFSGKTSSFLHAKKLPALRASTTGTAAEMLINNIAPNASFQQSIKDKIDSQQHHTQHHNHHHHHHHHPLSRQNEELEGEEPPEPKLKVPQSLFKKKIVGDLFGTSTTDESLAGLMYRSRIIENDVKKVSEVNQEEKAQLDSVEDALEEDDENSDSENETRLLKSMNPKQQLAITIKNWSAFPENDVHLIKEGAVYALIALSHVDDTTIRTCCASAFYHLSSRDTNWQELLSIGMTNGVTALAIPLGAHLSALMGRKWKIAKLCTLTLCNLSMQVDGETTMAQEYAIMALMVLVGINGHSLLPICAQTMYNMTSCMHPFKGIERIIKLLLNTSLSGYDQSEILVKVLVNCSRYSWLRLRIIEEGGIAQLHSLVPTLYNRENRRELALCMLIALRSLSESSGCRADMLQKNSVELISNLLPIVEDDEKCRLLIMKILHNFIHPPTTISNQAFEIAAQVVTIVTLHAKDVPTIQYCSACFNLLTKEKVRGMKHLAVLAINSMSKLLQSTDSLTQFFAISSAGNLFFSNLCDDPSKLEQLVQFFVLNGGGIVDPAAKQALALALAKLSQDDSYMDTIERLDLLDRVLKLLMNLRFEHRDSLLLQESCCIAICRIALRLGVSMRKEERSLVTGTLFDLLSFDDRFVLSSAISGIRALGVSGFCPDEFLANNQFLSEIASIISRYRGDAELCRYGCAVLAVFSYDTQAHERLAEKDIMNVLFSNINSDDAVTRELVANSLCNLSVHAIACQTMIDMNVVEVLGQLSCSTSETILDLCAKSLCNLTCNSALHRKMIDNNVLEIILMIALVRTVSSQTKCTCAKALLNLVNDDNLPNIVESGAIRVFATLSTSPFLPVQTVCSKGFHLLTLNEKRRQELVKNRAVAQALFHMIKSSTSNSSRVKIRLGISVMNLLSCTLTCKGAIQSGALTCLKVVATMDFEELRDACARVILRMANDSQMHSLLFKEPIVAILLLIIQRHKLPATFELAIRALRCLSSIESYRKTFFRDQGYEALIGAIYSGKVVRRLVTEEICKAWANLSYVHEHAEPMIRSGSLALALQVLQQSHLASLSHTKTLLLIMVRNITDSSLAREYILLQGIFGNMVNLILQDFEGHHSVHEEEDHHLYRGIASIGYAAVVKTIYNLSLVHKLHEHLVSQGMMSAIQKIVFPLQGIDRDTFEDDLSMGSLGSRSVSNVPFRQVDSEKASKLSSSPSTSIAAPYSPNSSFPNVPFGEPSSKHRHAPPSGTRLYFSPVEVELLAKTLRLLAESHACHDQMVHGHVMDIFKALIYSNISSIAKSEIATAMAHIAQSKSCREELVSQSAVELLIALSITSDAATQAQCSVALGFLSEITVVSKGVVASLLLLGLNIEEGEDISDAASMTSNKSGSESIDKLSANPSRLNETSVKTIPLPNVIPTVSEVHIATDAQKIATLKSLLRDLMQDKTRFDSFVDALKDSNNENLGQNTFHPKVTMAAKIAEESLSNFQRLGRTASMRIPNIVHEATVLHNPVYASLVNGHFTRLAVAEQHQHLLLYEEQNLLKSNNDPTYYFETPESDDFYPPESGGLSRKLTVELPLPGIPTDRDLEPANRHKELNPLPVDQNPLPKDRRTPVFTEHHRNALEANVNVALAAMDGMNDDGSVNGNAYTRNSANAVSLTSPTKQKLKGSRGSPNNGQNSPHPRTPGKSGKQSSNRSLTGANIDPRSPLLRNGSGLFVPPPQDKFSRLASPAASVSRGGSKGKRVTVSRGESSGSIAKSVASEKDAAVSTTVENNDNANGRASAGFGLGDDDEALGLTDGEKKQDFMEKQLIDRSRMMLKTTASNASLQVDDGGKTRGAMPKLSKAVSMKMPAAVVEEKDDASLERGLSKKGSFTRSSF